MFAVYPSARQLSTKVRATVDFLAEQIADPVSWDRALFGKIAGFPSLEEPEAVQRPTVTASARSGRRS